MNDIDLAVLQACQEYVIRQQEMLLQLAAALGVEERQVYYTWAFRKCVQRGKLKIAGWSYFFHGMECDLQNQQDGRFLRLDFGPRGSVGILNDGGVLQLIMTSVAPGGEFPELKLHFSKSGPPFDRFSGDWQKMSQTWQSLENQGFFETADKNLVDLQARYTSRRPDGFTCVCFPPEISEEIQADCRVAHRQRLAPRTNGLIATANRDRPQSGGWDLSTYLAEPRAN